MTRSINRRCVWMATAATLLVTGVNAHGGVGSDPSVFCAGSGGDTVSVVSPAKPGAPAGRAGDWTDPVLIGSYLTWDYWSLNTAAGIDSLGYVHSAVRLWEYDDNNNNFDRYVVDSSGDLIDTILDAPGFGDAAAFTDDANHNFFARPVATTQNHSVVDSADYVHLFGTTLTMRGWEIKYSKLDPDGNTLIDWKIITSGADPWNFHVQPLVLSDDTVMVVWMRDTEDVCGARSLDSGETWSDIIVYVDRTDAPQASGLKAAAGIDDSLHFTWRTLDWNTYEEAIWYAKARPDDSIAVAESMFHEGNNWYPYLSVDNAGNLHVAFGTVYDVGTTIYYTKLTGDLDLDGHEATDEMLTIVPEQIVVSDETPVRYPACVPDNSGGVHIFFERGIYGRDEDKYVYYTMIAADCPADVDSSGVVDIDDLFQVLGAWGVCDDCPEDIDDSGVVDIDDIFAVLADWGPCG